MNYITCGESATWIDKHSVELFGVKLFQASISAVCRKERPHHKGFIFKYEKDVDK